MGGKQSIGAGPNGELSEAVKRAEERSGKIGVSGRYHRLPKRLEDDYVLAKGTVLGTGYNGAVFVATSITTSEKFAIKAFHLHGIPADKMLELKTEAEIFLSMDHPHVARLVGVYECSKQLNLVMECMEGGELFERVLLKKRFAEQDASHALWQMLLAVNYIHSRQVVHRDLKLENFLYEKKDSDHLKLIDFGFSHVWEPNTTMALSCGTLSYVAPEVLNKKYTSQCDLWSMGVITFILLLGYMPFAGREEEQCRNIKAGHFTKKPDKWKRLSPIAVDFIQRLLVVAPTGRMTAEEALEHAFIKNRGGDATRGRRPSADDTVDDSIVDALTSFAEATQFRRACMSMMAWSLTNEERKEVRDAFIAMDTNQRGTITLAELKQVLTERFHVEDAKIQPIFEALDTAKNDEIHYTEFLAAMVSTRIKMHDDMLEKTFKRFDVDNSGFITKDNLRTVLGESFDGTEVDKLVGEADANGDGQISYAEFIAYLKNEQSDERHAMVACTLIDRAGQQKDPEGDDLHEMPEGFLGLRKKMQRVSDAFQKIPSKLSSGHAHSPRTGSDNGRCATDENTATASAGASRDMKGVSSAGAAGAAKNMKGVSTVANAGTPDAKPKSRACTLL